jgi:hypothetical protein
MSSETIDVRVLTASHDLDDYDILEMSTLSVAVPYRTTESLRKLLWSAMLTYVFGNSSVDHVIRRYGHLWDKRKDKSFESDPCLLILRSTYEDVARIAVALEAVDLSDTTLGRICAKSALCRLEATFKAAYGLVRRDYIFETEAVVRMLLEQLAWAHEAHAKDDAGLRTLNPTKCITPFKAVFSDSGKFYGELSEGAHIDPSIVDNYLRFHSGGSKVIRRSAPDSQHSGYYITTLACIYLEVVQKLFEPYSIEEFGTLHDKLVQRHRNYCKLLNGDANDAEPLLPADA